MKAYIKPNTQVTYLNTKYGVMTITSLDVDRTTTTSTQYVKEDNSSSSRYNVWDDDWSD